MRILTIVYIFLFRRGDPSTCRTYQSDDDRENNPSRGKKVNDSLMANPKSI